MSRTETRINPHDIYVPLGTVKYMSLDMSLDSCNIGSDWALVGLRSLKPIFANTVSYLRGSHTRQLYIKSFAHKGPAERKVLAVTGFNGIVPGEMSSMPTFMMLPGGNSFEEVWTVTFKDGNIGEIPHLAEQVKD